jgi:hypothetical protein
MLRVIDRMEFTAKPDYFKIYLNAYKRKIHETQKDPENRFLLKQLIFYGVRFMNLLNEDQESAESRFTDIECVFSFIGNLTPAELITIFPVEKRFDGDKFQCKDYFYTMYELRKIGMDTKIGAANVSSLLWDYENNELRKLMVRFMGVISDIRRIQTGTGLMDEWAEKMGINTYYMNTDPATHQEYMQNSRTGAVIPVKKAKPRYLKLLY